MSKSTTKPTADPTELFITRVMDGLDLDDKFIRREAKKYQKFYSTAQENEEGTTKLVHEFKSEEVLNALAYAERVNLRQRAIKEEFERAIMDLNEAIEDFEDVPGHIDTEPLKISPAFRGYIRMILAEPVQKDYEAAIEIVKKMTNGISSDELENIKDGKPTEDITNCTVRQNVHPQFFVDLAAALLSGDDLRVKMIKAVLHNPGDAEKAIEHPAIPEMVKYVARIKHELDTKASD